MANDKKCTKCGKTTLVLVDDKHWLCGDCAIKTAIAALGVGIAMVSTSNGIAKMTIWPRQANDGKKG